MNIKPKTKAISLYTLILIVALFWGCSNNSSENEQNLIDYNSRSTWKAIRYELPEGYFMCEESETRYNPENNALTITVGHQNGSDENGWLIESELLTILPDGSILSSYPLPDYAERGIFACVFFEDEIWYSGSDPEGDGFILYCASISDGTEKLAVSSSKLNNMDPHGGLTHIAVDSDGLIWLETNGIVRIYSHTLIYQNTVKLNSSVFRSLGNANDGTIRGCANFNGSWGIAQIDPEAGVGLPTLLDHHTSHFDYLENGSLIYNGDHGIYCLCEENGEETVKELLNYIEIGIETSDGRNRTSIDDFYEPTEDFRQAFGYDKLLFVESLWKDNRISLTPILYVQTDEIPQNETVMIQLAHAEKLDDRLRSAIVAFNRDHKDVKIETLDYSGYTGDSVMESGKWRLTNDIVTGIVSPDIVLNPDDALIRKKLTLDLTPYLAVDDEVNLDNIFGSVLTYYTNSDKSIWGIGPYFSVWTIVSTPELLGKYANVDHWTMDEYLDFYEHLPEGVYASAGVITGQDILFNNGYDTIFFDRDNWSVSFDSPLYRRCLAYKLSLPNPEDCATLSFVNTYYLKDGRAFYMVDESAYHDGHIALRDAFVSDPLSIEKLFGTKDYALIGFPGARGTGGQVTTPFDFAVMKKTESPDACWEVLKYFFHLRESGISSIGGISSLKSEYDNKMEDYRNMLLAHFSDGSWEVFDPDMPLEEIDLLADMNHHGIPYKFEPLDEYNASRIKEYLDTTGYRRIDLLPYEVSGIGYEEIQALKGGVGTIDDCAKKIQSRVSLWLEEQK